MSERLTNLAMEWRAKAASSREEACRIRRTIKEPTDAEAFCNVRAEVWEQCAHGLEVAARALPARQVAAEGLMISPAAIERLRKFAATKELGTFTDLEVRDLLASHDSLTAQLTFHWKLGTRTMTPDDPINGESFALNVAMLVRSYDYTFRYEMDLLQKRRWIHGLLRHINIHSVLASDTPVPGDEFAKVLPLDAAAGDYLVPLTEWLEQHIEEYLISLAHELVDYVIDGHDPFQDRTGRYTTVLKSICDDCRVPYDQVVREFGALPIHPDEQQGDEEDTVEITEEELMEAVATAEQQPLDYSPRSVYIMRFVWADCTHLVRNFYDATWDGNESCRQLTLYNDPYCPYVGMPRPVGTWAQWTDVNSIQTSNRERSSFKNPNATFPRRIKYQWDFPLETPSPTTPAD